MENILEYINNTLQLLILIFNSNELLYIFVIFCIIANFYLKFATITSLKEMIRLSMYTHDCSSSISHLQTFLISLGSRVGINNIIGVGIAISVGGIGAIAWMWLIGIVGSIATFIETTLAQLYKIKSNQFYRAAPALYIKKLFDNNTQYKFIGTFAAILMCLISALVFPLFIVGTQVYSINSTTSEIFSINPEITKILITAVFGLFIIGGIKSVVKILERMVIIMAIIFLTVSFAVLLINITVVPSALYSIFANALSPGAALGGFFGMTFSKGLTRGIMSNETGMGSSGPIFGGIAKSKHPIEQGLVQSLSVYIDTLIFATATGIVLVVTNSYAVEGLDGHFLYGGLSLTYEKTLYFNRAVSVGLGIDEIFSNYIIGVLLILFGLSTSVSLYYQGEANIYAMNYLLFKKIKGRHIAVDILKIISICYVFVSCSIKLEYIYILADLGTCMLLAINMVGLILGIKIVKRLYEDYEYQLKNNKDISFDPKKLGINDTDAW